jgi:hypothetical protein
VPTYIRPQRVEITEGGGGLAVVVLIAAAVVLSAVAAVLDDIVITLAIAAVVAVAGSLAVLIWVLRRGRGTVSTEAPPLPLRARGVITTRARPAIEPARSALLGVVISERDQAQR